MVVPTFTPCRFSITKSPARDFLNQMFLPAFGPSSEEKKPGPWTCQTREDSMYLSLSHPLPLNYEDILHLMHHSLLSVCATAQIESQ